MTTAAANALIQAGFQAQSQGDLVAADRAYSQALGLQPQHATAMQLLGSLRRKQGDLSQAEALMRQSLAVDAKQPHVWNNLGNLLHAAGRSSEALPCYELATAPAAPSAFADAHYNWARVLHALGRLPEAAASLKQALAQMPQPTVAALQLHAQIEGDSGLIAQALATLDKALQLAPDQLSLLLNRAVMQQRANRHAEALAAHDHAAALGLDAAEAHYNRGNTLQSLGRQAEALLAYERALALDPEHALTLFNLARLRWRMGSSPGPGKGQGEPGFDTELRLAINANPTSSLLPGLQAHLLWRAERYVDAAAAYRLALARAPQAAGLLDGLGRSLERMGDTQAGLAAHVQALATAPDDVELRSNYAASLLVAGANDAALAAAQAACELAPQHQYAQALRVLAWRVLGDHARADALCDVHRFVAVIDLPPPPGYASMAAFNAPWRLSCAPCTPTVPRPSTRPCAVVRKRWAIFLNKACRWWTR